jgi:ATP-dependent Clp protease adaptor protein ClpS
MKSAPAPQDRRPESRARPILVSPKPIRANAGAQLSLVKALAEGLPFKGRVHKLCSMRGGRQGSSGERLSVLTHASRRSMAGKPWDDDGLEDGEPGRESGVATKTRTRTKKPSLFRVLLLNDDYTPMEFVVYVLERFFNKGREDATRIMLHVHQHGVGLCGVYTYEVAETKVAQVLDLARRHEHPLQCTMEKD